MKNARWYLWVAMARKYSQILPSFWTGKTGRELRGKSTHTQLLAIYLLTSPHSNMAGIYYCPIAYIENDTGLDDRLIEEAFDDLENLGFAYRDAATDEVFVVNMVKYQVGEDVKPRDKRGVKVVENLLKTSSDSLRTKWLDAHGRGYIAHGAPSNTPCKPHRGGITQEQEQEHEHEIKQEQENPQAVENF